ncbi:MAG: prolipoprotein diacylglyceryl transferase [Bacillota bacterium]
MNPIAFKIGFLSVRWYGILIGSAVLIGFFLVIKESRKKGIDEEFFYDFIIYGLPGAIIGARLYYVIFNWSYYKNDFSAILNIRQGGLAIHGAIIAGIIIIWILVKKYKVNFWEVVDIIAPSLILGQAIGRWGNFINQEAYGKIVSSDYINKFPDFIKHQMFIEGYYRQPTFLYESIWNILVFGILIFLRRRKFIKNGDIFALYLILYSAGRFVIEKMRTDSLLFEGIMVARLISIFLIILGITVIFLRHRKGTN